MIFLTMVLALIFVAGAFARQEQMIEKTVHEVNPEMPIGFMTTDIFYAGYDFGN